MPPPRPLPSLPLAALLPVAAWLVVRPLVAPPPPLPALHTSAGFAVFALLAALWLIPALAPTLLAANLKGRDLLKVDGAPIPESLGLVCAGIYILLLIVFIPFPFSNAIADGRDDILNSQLALYLSSLLSLLLATMLGFLDDLFDIRWRHKLPIPLLASIPLLMVYHASHGATAIAVPLPLRAFLPPLLELGPLYYVWMALLSTFTTNSINILAGCNGVEAGQALIIALSVILNDLLYLPWPFGFTLPLHLLGLESTVAVGGGTGGMSHGSEMLVGRHLFSLYFMLPLVGVIIGFLYHNWYPARVFPGDTLCYLTGMAFAVVGIHAHFTKTLLLFFIPQLFNFALSTPQLFGLVPCPRHRVPRFEADEGMLYPSVAVLKGPPPLVVTLLAKLGLTRLTHVPASAASTPKKGAKGKPEPALGAHTTMTNLTLLNVLLLRLGPLREPTLVRVLLAVQVAGSVLGFVVRYGLAGLVYDGDRR